ncbi:MAG: ribosome small subunit-dependent GTPase A, partial [Bacillota bacterium]|nr:ribosome small subunit-dependent GTPase A [Bacillota bacterium]
LCRAEEGRPFSRQLPPVLAGDRVLFTRQVEGTGVIEEVLPRRSYLVRPPVANVQQLIVVFATTRPDPDLVLLDRLLVTAEYQGLVPLVCFNKIDLSTPRAVAALARPYRQAGYKVLRTSAKEGTNLPSLRRALQGKISALAGPSGVGKSALINALTGAGRPTGEVAARTGRGRHTTRTVEFLPLPGGGFIADTPGFSALDTSELTPSQLAACFPEIARHAEGCRFGSSCRHDQEPGCAVKAALDRGEIAAGRYQNYLLFLRQGQEKARGR